MLSIFKNNNKKTTTAIIFDSETDAMKHISKKLGLGDITNPFRFSGLDSDKELMRVLKLDKALMNNKYSGTVTCDDRDNYDEAVGEDEAVKKAIANHNRGFVKAITRWQSALIKQVIDVSPETFDEALEKVYTGEKR